MAELRCQIRLRSSLSRLVESRSAFTYLLGGTPDPSTATRWTRGKIVSREIQTIVIGKTGFGKSSTLNRLLGVNVFQTSEVDACTRVMQSADFAIGDEDDHDYISFSDLPGIGESKARDAEYIELYRRALRGAHAVIYVLRADQRDYSVDEWAIDRLFLWSGDRDKIIVGLNCIDMIAPINRSVPFRMTGEQRENLAKKVVTVSETFGFASDRIVPISALENHGLDLLALRLQPLLTPHLDFSG